MLTKESKVNNKAPEAEIEARISKLLPGFEILGRINEIITSISNPKSMLDELVSLIQQEFGYPYVNLFLLNASRKTLTLQNAAWRASKPKRRDFVSIPADQGTIGWVAASGESVLATTSEETPTVAPHPSLANIKSQLCVPLGYNHTLIGVLDVESDVVGAFSEADRQVLQTLADQIALAIENIRLRNGQQRFLREQGLIYESIVTLGTEKDEKELVQVMSEKIARAVDAGACVICRIDSKKNLVTPVVEYVADKADNPPCTWRVLDASVPASEDPIGRKIGKGSQAIVQRAERGQVSVWQRPKNEPSPQSLWHTVLVIPFEVKPLIAGFVEVYDKNPNRAYSVDDVKICRILATQTAVALEQAHLFEQTIQRLSEMTLLYVLAQKISSSLDLEDVLDAIVSSLKQAIGCRACCIFLIDETGQQLEIKAANGLKPEWRQAAKLRLGEGAAGMAAAEGRTIYMPDTREDANYIFFDEDVRSLMVVPLQAQGKIIGTINVDDNRPNAFGPTQERLLTIAAAQAGITIENARLFLKISKEQKQTQAIMQHMADGLLLIDTRGIVVTCNSTLALMLGLSPEEIVGQNIHDPHIHPNLASIATATTQYARTGVLSTEVTIDSPQPKAFKVLNTQITDDYRTVVGEVRLIHDVTRERELEQLKDDFFSTISHELRTPLFSIQGFAQLMSEEEYLDRATQKEFLGTIQRQAQQLSEMVNNLLDLSQFDAGKLVFDKISLNLLELLNQTVLKLQGFAHQRDVRLLAHLPPQLPAVVGDSQRLEQVLTNLIGNAIKFSPAGQIVVVAASLRGSNILIQVQDQGVGIPAEDLDRIFSRYYQAHNKSERSAMGSGLGLHIAKKIVEGHGGKIWAESTAGSGSTFCFTLPLPNRS